MVTYLCSYGRTQKHCNGCCDTSVYLVETPIDSLLDGHLILSANTIVSYGNGHLCRQTI
ncbi:MAG: hypothetical protein ACI8UP_004589 [Porticoccaceae bacterium]|jgi:hypothetical protein